MGNIDLKQIANGMYVSTISRDEIANISKPLLSAKKLTKSDIKELSPGLYVVE